MLRWKPAWPAHPDLRGRGLCEQTCVRKFEWKTFIFAAGARPASMRDLFWVCAGGLHDLLLVCAAGLRDQFAITGKSNVASVSIDQY